VSDTATTARDAGTRRARLLAGAAAAGIAAAGIAAHLVNPARDAWLPKCPFHELTGLWCPGCGSTRAACALMHGNVAEAFRHNVLFLPAIAALIWAWAAFALRAAFPQLRSSPWLASPFSWRSRWLWALPVIVVAFWVVRNVPGAPEHLLSS
jgi:hypothetical protein